MGTVHFSVSLAKPVKMFKELLLIVALAVAAAHGSPFKKGFPIKFLPLIGKREAEPSYRSYVNNYSNYGYNLGQNNNGYQQLSIHKRSPFKKGFPIKFLPLIGKREAEPSYGYNLGENNNGYQQHSIHKRSPFKKGFP